MWLVVAAAQLALSAAVLAAQPGFTLEEKPGEWLDVLVDGRLAARYMLAHDTSTPARRVETNKPYLHVFDAEGKAPITNGPAGLYPHHRGIFIGWTRIGFQGKSYDFWGMGGGEMVHREFTEKKADADQATFTSRVEWLDKSGQLVLEELRTMTLRRAPPPGRLLIDFTTTLKAPNGDVLLDGDPEHGGTQYRPANEVAAAETLYVFPREDANAHADLDYPWVGETYTLAGKRYSVVHMNHPDNPKGTRYSAYRDYGRFGAFFKRELKSGETLTLRYGHLIAEGEMPAAEVIQKCWDEFAGVSSPSRVPKITVKPAEGASGAKAAPKK